MSHQANASHTVTRQTEKPECHIGDGRTCVRGIFIQRDFVNYRSVGTQALSHLC